MLVAATCAGLLILMDRTSYDTWGAVFVAPVLLAVSIPALRHEAEREGDPHLFTVLVSALVLKLGASLVRYFVAFGVYGVADAGRYMQEGAQFATQFHHLDFAVGPFTGTHFPSILTGLVYSVTVAHADRGVPRLLVDRVLGTVPLLPSVHDRGARGA